MRSVYDGDTIRADVDLGFRVNLDNVAFRLNRINAPELGTLAGKPARDMLKMWLPADKDLIIVTHKDETEKYGRYLADLYVDGVCLNDQLVNEGFAKYWDGSGQRPV